MAIKKTKRKAFNFLRSYFDVFNELQNDKDRLSFLTSIINKQFLDEDPKGLNFISNLCYESQRHQIESSVNGWKRANKETPLTTLGTNPPTTQMTDPKEVQVKEEVKEEKQSKIDYDSLLNLINSKTGRSFRIVNNSIKQKYSARLKEGYTKEDILNAIKNSVLNEFHINNNFSYLTPEFFSRSSTLDKYSTKSNIKPTLQVSHSTPVN